MSNFLKNVSIEPCLLVFIIVQEWMRQLDSNLFLQKACRFNQTAEPDLNTKCDDEKRGILFVSQFHSSYDFPVSLLNTAVMIFASIWSDETGRRRPLIFIPIFGLILHALSGCLNSYFWHWIPSAAVVSWVVIRGFCCGPGMLVAFCALYICDISDAENRTMRVGLTATIRTACILLGKGGSGFILRSIGFFYFYVVCFILSVTSLLLGLIFIKDNSVSVEKKIPFNQMFSLKRILFVDSFKVVFNRKLGKKRIIVSSLILVNFINIFASTGEMSMLYLYLRHRFEFDERMYSGFVLGKFSLVALGVLFCSFVLSKRLKIHDCLIGMFAAFCNTLAVAVLLFATETWHLFSSNVLDMFHSVVSTTSVFFMTKYYTSDELNQLNAVKSAFTLAVPLSLLVYHTIFQKTLDTFPSAYCIPSIVLNIGLVIFFVASYSLSRKLVERERVAKKEELTVTLDDVSTASKAVE